MASTYTSSLGLEKQATGENENTWGTNLNTNEDYTDKAVAGVLSKSVAGAADVTLTAAEALNAVHQYTGTLTGAISVIVPASTKPYMVFNNTAGAYALTVTTAAGTGIVVTQGTQAILYCDGTNVLDLISTGGFLLAASDLSDLASATTAATNLGLGTGDSPQFTGIELGHADDTTFARVSAGIASIQGAVIGLLSKVQVWAAAQRATVTTITSTSNSIAINLDDSNDFYHLFTENTTLANVTGTAVAGQKGTIYFEQAAGANYTLAYGSDYFFVGGTAFTVTATNAAKDSIDYAVRADGMIELSGFAGWSQ